MRDRYRAVRARTLELVAPLSYEDCQVQSMPDASPTKWHLAHTSWFFETFVLERYESAFRAFDPAFRALFNSYYNAVGSRHPRAQRGLVTRPSLKTVRAYRADVDQRMHALLTQHGVGDPVSATDYTDLTRLVELGLQHEQQHQELILTDLLHLLSCNPTHPVYRAGTAPEGQPDATAAGLGWTVGPEGLALIGHDGQGFAFDNEGPRHRVWLRPYALANGLVTNGQWLLFVRDGGYKDPRWWLSAGWDWVQTHGIESPAYWQRVEDRWHEFTLRGLQPLVEHQPVMHISCYEAHAYAQWCAASDTAMVGTRLPTEAEWEAAVEVAEPGSALRQLFDTAWQWTSSAYVAYPGFVPWAGEVGEYNGKFMINQQVLRGGSLATPAGHSRASYRNFFPADARWQFTGLRLARDLD